MQGDISINNPVDNEEGLIVFDYNNAGDEVLISEEDYASANRLLRQIVVDMTEPDDGRFRLHF